MFKYAQRPNRITKTDTLGKDPISFLAVSYKSVFPADINSEPLYANEVFEVDVITSGSGIYQILGQTIPCEKGDIFVIPSGIPHNRFVAADGDEMQISQLTFDLLDWFGGEIVNAGSPRYCYGIFDGFTVFAYAPLNANAYAEILKIMHKIAREAAEKEQQWNDMVRASLSTLLIILSRYIGTAKHLPLDSRKEWLTATVALQLISENFKDSSLTLETLAERLYVSKSQFSRLFINFTGSSFSDHLRNIRLNYACSLLRDTDMTVKEIVAECGMRDIRSFYKNFKNYTGKTPNQYKAEIKSIQDTEERIMVVLSEISEKMQQGRGKIVAELVQQALDEGCDPEKILSEGLLSGMDVVGAKFRNNEIFVPEVLVAARAMNMGAQILKPYLAQKGVEGVGKICLGTVQGDLHDIGKNLVKMMMEGKGIEVIDLGTDVPPEKFIQTAIEEKCDVICCSALLTTTMGVMGEVVKAAEAAGIRDHVKIMIGGAPVTEDFSKQIGADAYTADAATAASVAFEFCRANRKGEKQ